MWCIRRRFLKFLRRWLPCCMRLRFIFSTLLIHYKKPRHQTRANKYIAFCQCHMEHLRNKLIKTRSHLNWSPWFFVTWYSHFLELEGCRYYGAQFESYRLQHRRNWDQKDLSVLHCTLCIRLAPWCSLQHQNSSNSTARSHLLQSRTNQHPLYERADLLQIVRNRCR